MRFTRKLAWTVTPLVAVALSVGGIAVAGNAWHVVGGTHMTAAGNVGVVLPVSATATIADIYPGQPMIYTVTFNNPNKFDVNVLALQAVDASFVNAADAAVTLTQHRSYDPLWAMSATTFDWYGTQAVAPGTHTVTLTAGLADVTWANALKQGSPISLIFWVDEAAF